MNVNSPITVTGTPSGWEFTTDMPNSVGWFNTDIEEPYPDDIPPGGSKTFEITSNVTTTELLRYTVAAWNHATDMPGPQYRDLIPVPSIQAIPEPSAVLFLALAFAISLLGLKWMSERELDSSARK